MSTARCCVCGREIDLTTEDEGDYNSGEFVCSLCLDGEMREAEEYINRMRQVAREGTR